MQAAALATVLAGSVALPTATATAATASRASTGAAFDEALSPNVAGYAAEVTEFGYPYTGVQATWLKRASPPFLDGRTIRLGRS
jgi:hypothetical protein